MENRRAAQARLIIGISGAYEKAAGLLADLHALAAEQGTEADFNRRLASIHARHETKRTFIERLDKLGLGRGERIF